MEQKNILKQALDLIKNQRRHRQWLWGMTGLAALVVFMTVYLLILPAITMEHSGLEITAESLEASWEEAICTKISALAENDREETVFSWKTEGADAGLDESGISFDADGIAWIQDENGEVIELHRDFAGDGVTNYWFVLGAGQSRDFSLSWKCNEPQNLYENAEESEGAASDTEYILDQTGNANEKNLLTISYGWGSNLDEANEGNESFTLCWLLDTEKEAPNETSEIPLSEIPPTGSEAAPENSIDGGNGAIGGASASDSGLSSAFLSEDLKGKQEKEGSYDFSDDITSVTVSKMENGQWVPGSEFTAGDSVRMEIHYIIPANTVGEDNHTIHYQLPEGIRLSQQESGTVYDGQTPVGTYIINTDGLITITFQDTFSDDKPFNGMIRFEGTLSGGQDGSEEEIEFGGDGGTITVKPDKSPTDIHLEKEGEYDSNTEKLNYTITVSTEKGTGDTVTISDWFSSGDTAASYDKDSFHIVKVDANGGTNEISGYTPEFSENTPPSFSISGLPKLEAGEKYVVTYTASPGETNNENGASHVANSAVGTSGNDNSSDWNDVTISHEVVQKWGTYDGQSGTIRWTIVLNKDKRDIGGYKLKDTMTINGENVSIPQDTVITMTGEGGSSQTITLPYTFPEGSCDTYTITYETKAPEGAPGESWTTQNKAEIEREDETYTGQGTVTGQTPDYGIHKQFENIVDSSANVSGIYQWVSRITVPDTELDLEKLTYTDTLTAAAADGKEEEDIHYITTALLGNMSVTVNGTPLTLGVDYEIWDAKGKIEDFNDNETRLTGFQVKFLEEAKEKLKGHTVELRYQTRVDYTGLKDDVIYTIRNTGSIPGHESKAETTYERPKKLEKQASITGNNGNSYTDEGICVDYEQSGGIIHYRLLLHTDQETQGDITLTDLLPKGASLVTDSVTMRFYGNDYYEYPSIQYDDGTGHITYEAANHIRVSASATNPDGTTLVTFTIDDGYNGDGTNHILAIYYKVSVKEDTAWTEDPATEKRLYRNQVTWGTENAATDVTVEREVPDVEKIGEQLPQYDSEGNPVLDSEGNPVWSDTVRYYILINIGAKDLVENRDVITLWDKLDVGNAAAAEFLPGSVRLYYYDASQENSCGSEMDASLYSYTYDEKEYVLTFSLPDETACVLTYDYIVDRGNAAGDISVKNQAHLTGGASSGGGTEVILEETSSSATATKKELTLYKVDASDFGLLLPGAVFELKVYEDGGWKTLLTDLTTDENGEFTLTRDQDTHFENFNFEDNTLYSLTEIQAPEGYTASGESYYFVWVEEGKTAEEIKQEMIANGTLGGVASESVNFLTTSEAAYIRNEPCTLTVKKLWQDENGVGTEPGTEKVKVNLLCQTVTSNAKTVTVMSTGHQSWSQTHTSIVNVAEGSSLTIQITGVYKDSLDIQVGEKAVVPVLTGPGQVWTYTIDTVEDNTTVKISPTDQNEGNSFGNISFFEYTTPFFVPEGDAEIYATVELNPSNKWSYTWENLPKTDENGKMLYYHVEELSPVPGYEILYPGGNHDGLQAGELVIINRANGYILPETGGSGLKMFTAGGFALMALAALMYRILHRKGDGVS